ncbi:MAG: DNA-packaging protein [Alphaproteobacteria bacterium]|nr:DNA-packaging protein [Alphaproteobacteria bacterium]
MNDLSDDDVEYMLADWVLWGRKSQKPPPGDWNVWLFLGGRGAGKTRAGAEWVAQQMRQGRKRVALIAATHADARAVMIEGPSGLLSCSEGAEYEPSLRRVRWPASGAEAAVMSADEPDSIRGYQFELCWGDEFCKWPEPQAALDMVRMGLRLGENPRMMITTTPRPIPALLELFTSSGCTATKSTTYDNAANLAKSFIASMKKSYGKTRLGRQELDGEIIEDVEGALWQRDRIEALRVKQAPACERVVVGIDPPVSKKGTCGIVVAGLCGDHAYVLADCTKEMLSPAQWADRAADAYERFEADCVVAESNQGGEMVQSTLFTAHSNMKVKLVHASKGKVARAEPVSALYEQGRVHHAGVFPELEDQLCQFDGTGPSPDRLDALVWALTELFPQNRKLIPVPRVRVI